MNEYQLLERAIAAPRAFILDTFHVSELWRPTLGSLPYDLPGKEFLSEVGLPLTKVTEIADIGMGFDPTFQVRHLHHLFKNDNWGLNKRFEGMYCLKHEGNLSFTCVSTSDNGALFLLTRDQIYGEYYINSSIEMFGVALAAYRAHLNYTSTMQREEVALWDERFFSFMQVLDPACCGPNETYWSRVQEFLSFR